MTAPSAARRSFVRTNAPPLPGLTCWNSTILKTVPSTSMWLPFLNWLVLITAAEGSPPPAVRSRGLRPHPLQREVRVVRAHRRRPAERIDQRRRLHGLARREVHEQRRVRGGGGRPADAER